jgi:hypothetical protein
LFRDRESRTFRVHLERSKAAIWSCAKGANRRTFPALVRPRGLEPLTFAAAVRRSNPLSYGRLRAANKPWGLVDARASFLGLVRRKLVSDSRFELIALQLQASAWGFRFTKLPVLFSSRAHRSPMARLVRVSSPAASSYASSRCARFFAAEGRGFEPRSPFGRTGFRDRLLAVRSSLRREW